MPILKDMMRTKPRADWLAGLEGVGVPCGPINDLEQLFDDPHVQSRERRIELPHPLAGVVPQVANPIRYSDAELAYSHAGPTLGQHTDEVLGGLLGMSGEDIAGLRDRGII